MNLLHRHIYLLLIKFNHNQILNKIPILKKNKYKEKNLQQQVEYF